MEEFLQSLPDSLNQWSLAFASRSLYSPASPLCRNSSVENWGDLLERILLKKVDSPVSPGLGPHCMKTSSLRVVHLSLLAVTCEKLTLGFKMTRTILLLEPLSSFQKVKLLLHKQLHICFTCMVFKKTLKKCKKRTLFPLSHVSICHWQGIVFELNEFIYESSKWTRINPLKVTDKKWNIQHFERWEILSDQIIQI